MTPRQSVVILAVAAAFALLLVTLSVARAGSAAVAARSAEATLERVRAEAERVLVLRGRSQTVALGAQPQADAFQRVNETLAACGLASTRVESVTPSGDRPLPGNDVGMNRRVQTFRVVLSPILPDELGSFLDRWRREHGLWTLTGIDLTPASGRGTPDGTFRATLTASAVYVDGSAVGANAESEREP